MSATERPGSIGHRIAAIRGRIAAAAFRSGRDPADVSLVAVSKTHRASAVLEAWKAGIRIFGENRVEEAGPKAAAVASMIRDPGGPRWHMVGHVQSRKASDLNPWCDMVQSVDTLRLATRLDRVARESGRVLSILLEVNISGEDAKYGFAPGELDLAIPPISELSGLRIDGLMTVAPIAADPEALRPVFGALRDLQERLRSTFPNQDWRHLSMGMSDDFEVAIEEGATLVRIGRAIFGERAN